MNQTNQETTTEELLQNIAKIGLVINFGVKALIESDEFKYAVKKIEYLRTFINSDEGQKMIENFLRNVEQLSPKDSSWVLGKKYR